MLTWIHSPGHVLARRHPCYFGTEHCVPLGPTTQEDIAERQPLLGQTTLVPGDLILLDTDDFGSNEPLDEDETVVDLLRTLEAASPARICELVQEVRGHHPEGPGGTALIAIRVSEELRPRSWVIPSTSEASAEGRLSPGRNWNGWASASRLLVDNAMLIVSELMSNVVKHTASDARLSIQRLPHAVRIEVEDVGNESSLEIPTADVMADKGRGRSLIDAVAKEWGVDRSRGRQKRSGLNSNWMQTIRVTHWIDRNRV